ncbi:MAG: GHMP kinase, partial [Gammaproteobacteria bacterium]
EKLSTLHPISVFYAGFKTPTVEAIKRVQTYFSAHPQLFRHLHTSIGQCALDGIQHVRQGAWAKLGEMMNVQQGMMESLGVSLPLLRDLIEGLRQQSTILGAKISGSGLGDCVIGLGESTHEHPSAQRISVMMSQQGVHCEKI